MRQEGRLRRLQRRRLVLLVRVLQLLGRGLGRQVREPQGLLELVVQEQEQEQEQEQRPLEGLLSTLTEGRFSRSTQVAVAWLMTLMMALTMLLFVVVMTALA